MLLVVVPDELLIEREVHLMGRDGGLVVLDDVDLVRHFFQRSKVLLNGLIHQNITICQIEYLAL